ncbi:type I 3-dehydroquinate dehydratase [Treponema zioleckii]|uniref:type I 3-dehydroquinate dehydratase n=1 Tax=Treponema zioleckii TaxID=331680 RepID=UPI00168BC0F6|nr:type I 3-dehydroquinate dehydratase [Treponema zioleckii]
MARPLICLCLTGATLEEDLAIAEQYRQYIDIVELRVDFLEDDERLNIRNFPSMVKIPCILTIRRVIDGGRYSEGEASRTMLFARALAFAEQNSAKNFAYVDFEEDFNVPSLQDAAMAFGTKIIRSYHNMTEPVSNIVERVNKMRVTGFEIPKIAFMPHSLQDVTDLLVEAEKLKNSNQILCAMGPLGLPTRILAARFHSYLTYTSPSELIGNLAEIGHIDPKTLETRYYFHSLEVRTKIFGITGYPLKVTSSPKIHNAYFKKNCMNAVYIPFRSESAQDAFHFAKTADIKGFSVTIPHKENIMAFLDKIDPKAQEIGACNTVINDGGVWTGFNTDCTGFQRALLEFTSLSDLKGKNVAIIGAGGASKAIAFAVHELGAKACVFNRTIPKARKLAEQYGFDYAPLDAASREKLREYSDIIIQTTSKGMGATSESDETNDPIWFYEFLGTELLFDIVYEPEVTPVMQRAAASGCKVCNGFKMLEYQAEAQFELYKKVYEQN